MAVNGSGSIELRDLIVKRTRTLQIPINDAGEFFTIDWSPVDLTYQVHDAMMTALEGKKVEPLVDSLLPVVKKWSITVDGKPYPVTQENMTGLGVFVAGAIAGAILDDFPKLRDAKKDSGGG